MNRSYKVVLILKSELKKEAKEKLLKDVISWSGKVEKEKINDLGEKKFTYPIKGAQKGNYVVVEFESVAVSKDLDAKARINDDILRHLVVRTN